ncbi:MAG: C40 family peptidase [Oscillospiraceae bacterium]
MSEQTSNSTSGQNVPKSKFRRKSRQEQTAASKLRMERRGEKLDAAREKLAKQKPPKKPGAVKRLAHTAGHGVHGFVHGKLYEVEHENVGTEGAHRSELAAESVYRFGRRKLRKAIREHPAKAVERAESKHIKATADYYYRKTVEEHPEMQEGGAVSRYLQKQKIKRQYAKQAREAARQTAKAAEGTASVTGKLAEKVSAYIKEHPGGLLLLLAAFLLLVVLQSCMSSLVTVGNGVAGAIGASTYAAADADLLGAEAAYCALEDELQRYLDTYTRTHDYDEYHFDLDTIEHDPYVLLSIVCALHEGEWTLDEVRGTLQMLFDRQYILTEDVEVERRYYLETDTWTDEDGNTHSDTYRVYYDYYICTVTLENFNLSHLPIYIMGEETLSRYALYMATLGNRPDLFPSSPYVGKYTNKPPAHEIPEDYLADETFTAILKEAEKYVGYPYVWGGSSPSTSFDCSGFVSYVYNQCGWSFGRLGAQGLYNISTRTSSPKPGDLVFFTGTYDTPGISHVGIYVGDGWMLHCGDPISYANLNTSYWQSHFYAYGKLF